jgi:peptidoglycan hydrolase CwlO-like protein
MRDFPETRDDFDLVSLINDIGKVRQELMEAYDKNNALTHRLIEVQNKINQLKTDIRQDGEELKVSWILSKLEEI